VLLCCCASAVLLCFRRAAARPDRPAPRRVFAARL